MNNNQGVVVLLNKKYEAYRVALGRLVINPDFVELMKYLKYSYCEQSCIQDNTIQMVARIAQKELVEKLDMDSKLNIETYEDNEEDKDER